MESLPEALYHRHVGDSITRKIDGFFNVVDAGIGHATNFLGRGNAVEKKIDESKAARKPPSSMPGATPEMARTVAVAKPKARVIEAIDAETQETRFTVICGNEKVDCTSAEMAERVRKMMEGA